MLVVVAVEASRRQSGPLEVKGQAVRSMNPVLGEENFAPGRRLPAAVGESLLLLVGHF